MTDQRVDEQQQGEASFACCRLRRCLFILSPKKSSKVPYVCLALLFQLLGTAIDGSSTSTNEKQITKHYTTTLAFQIPERRLPAETILLEDKSTTFISTLEDYLAQTNQVNSSEQPGAAATVSQTTTIANNTTAAASANSTSLLPSAALVTPGNQLEREEIAQSSAIVASTERERAASGALETTTASKVDTERLSRDGHEQTNEPTTETAGERPKKEAESSSKHESQPTAAAATRQDHGSNSNPSHGHGHGHGAAVTSSNGTKLIPQHWQVRSLLNVTHDYPLAYSQIICGYVWPLMAALTLFTNLMIVFVLIQRDMRTPTNVVLTAIAIADIIPIVVPVPWFVYLFAMGNEKQVLYPPIACYFYQHSTRSISEVFYFLSTWLNVLLAVQDYLTACRPNLAKKYCQIRVVIIEIILLTFLAFLLNLPQALKLVFKPVKFYYNGQLTWGCKALQAKWFKDLVGEYVALYDDIFTAIIVLFVDGGPAIALIALTALLIRHFQRQRIQGHLLMEQARTASKRRRERHRQQESEASARVMIFVLLAFLAVKIPFATTYTLMIIQSRFEIRFVENLVDFQKAITLTDLVFVLSYPINFTIFCCCSKKFRHKCAQLLGECNANTKSARNKLMRSFSTSYDDSDTLNQIYKRDSTGTLTSIRSKSKDNLFAITSQSNGDVNSNTVNDMTINASAIPNADKISCDGQNHVDSAYFALAGGELTAEFRAQLDDGSICIECIMRYERMKRLHQGRLVAEAAALAAGNLENRQQQQLQEEQQSRRRTSSLDSTSWPICPPPTLPPLRIVQQLPVIITTRCESINEKPSSDEGSAELKSQLLQQKRPSEISEICTENSSKGGSDLDLSNTRYANSLSGSCSNFKISQTASARSCSKSLSIQDDRKEANAPTTKPCPSPGSRSASARRGLSEGLFGLKQLSGLLRRFSDNSSEHSEVPSSSLLSAPTTGSRRHKKKSGQKQTEAMSLRASGGISGEETLGVLEQKSRSLSMSDSKLTTLPNATGMLADIMMSTLLTSTTMHQAPGQDRSPISEPPIHLSHEKGTSNRHHRHQHKQQQQRQQNFKEAGKR